MRFGLHEFFRREFADVGHRIRVGECKVVVGNSWILLDELGKQSFSFFEFLRRRGSRISLFAIALSEQKAISRSLWVRLDQRLEQTDGRTEFFEIDLARPRNLSPLLRSRRLFVAKWSSIVLIGGGRVRPRI